MSLNDHSPNLPTPPLPASASQSEVSRVAFKAPAFWRGNPELWFLQLESQFVVSGITLDATKYHCVVAALDGDVLSLVSDIIRQPPTSKMYDAIKQRIITNYGDSEMARLKMLLKDLELGDKRPSHLLRSMQELAGSSISSEILRSLFLQRLPVSVQQILTVCIDKDETDLSKLAEKADKILEVTQNSPSIESVSASNNQNFRFEKLENEIAKLSEAIQHISRPRFRNKGARSNSRESRSKSKPRINEKPLCWYHHKFGVNANKCVPPCNFTNKSEN